MKSAKEPHAISGCSKNVISFPLTQRKRREKDELAFLPAALEIVEGDAAVANWSLDWRHDRLRSSYSR